MNQVLDFVPIWTLILGLAVFFYVLLDGFDLGVGMLYGLAPDTASRNTIMNSIAPVWDGNETWLVFGGLGLLSAFPLAFAIIIPAVYFPILVMLLALVFRGVAFEFRFRDAEHRTFWDHAFCYGSGDREPEFAMAARLTGRWQDELAALTTHQLPLEDVATAFGIADDKTSGAIKVTLTP